jgi:crotonobetainyl-CoA:carnitine CoA-transferase CaiB-like acyl-CoA transferase
MASNYLDGVRVVDLSRVLAGPLCSMILGDLGAHVLKIERPGVGDETRAWGPPFDDRGESAYYLSVNRNKLSIALSFDDPRDRDFLVSLIADADIVLDNFIRGALERRGLAPEALLARFPNLLWCTLTGFGIESDRAGYDYVVQAESGWMAITGEVEGDPMKTGVALADVVAGKDAAISILAALAARHRAGSLPLDARRLTISLAKSATAALVNVAQNALVAERDANRWGNAHANLVPYQLFRARDRHLVVAVGNDAQWRACCEALELIDLRDDSALATNSGRLAHRDRLVASMAARLAERDAGDWLALLDRAKVPAGLVRGVLEALEDVAHSALTGVAPATPGSVRYPPPTLDEHGELVRKFRWSVFEHVPILGP